MHELTPVFNFLDASVLRDYSVGYVVIPSAVVYLLTNYLVYFFNVLRVNYIREAASCEPHEVLNRITFKYFRDVIADKYYVMCLIRFIYQKCAGHICRYFAQGYAVVFIEH